jgi:hypothetical protein
MAGILQFHEKILPCVVIISLQLSLLTFRSKVSSEFIVPLLFGLRKLLSISGENITKCDTKHALKIVLQLQ